MPRPRRTLPQADAEVDLVPLIDCVFLLLLFFMLCGHMSLNEREEQITVPPALTAAKITLPRDWRHEVINLQGGRAGEPVRITMGQAFDSRGGPFPAALTGLRAILDRLHAMSPTYGDLLGDALPQVQIELRADGDVPWRALQEVQQVLADSIDPASGQPRSGRRKPFPTLAFSVRDPLAP
jgi:hypothetical protein